MIEKFDVWERTGKASREGVLRADAGAESTWDRKGPEDRNDSEENKRDIIARPRMVVETVVKCLLWGEPFCVWGVGVMRHVMRADGLF